ncbi:Profilin, partial [Caligus rogercresseyi]
EESKMSWQTYVDDQLLSTKMVKHAVICGHDGNIWAQDADFQVSEEEEYRNFHW